MYGYLYERIENHINNNNIHGNKGTTINYTYNTTVISGESAADVTTISVNLGMLEKDTVVYLSITDSVNEINEKIKSTPHNLNGYNLAFIFVVPQGYYNFTKDEEIYAAIENKKCEISLDVGNQNIVFSNFFNGTLFIFGDFLQDTKFYNSITKENEINFLKFRLKNKVAIQDPVRYDGINSTVYINKLYKEIDNPESIIDIINYENSENLEGVISLETLNKIKIKGTCLNSNYSLITISDVTAKTYIKNLSFESTLIAKDNVIDISNQFISNLPTKDKVFIEYPLESDGNPIIGDALKSYLETASNQRYFDLLNNYYYKNISSSIDYLYNIMNDNNFIINNENYLDIKINDQYITILRSQLDELKKLPGLSANFYDIKEDSYSNYTISASILSSISMYKVPEESDFNQSDIRALYDSFINTYLEVKRINDSRPNTKLSGYIDGNEVFRKDEFMTDLKTYVKNIKEFISDLSAVFYLPAFGYFLMNRMDLLNSNEIPDDEFSDDVFTMFIKNYEIDTYFNSLQYSLSGIELNVINQMTDIQVDNLSSYFSFNTFGSNINYEHILPLKDSSDDYLKTNYFDSSVDAVTMNYEDSNEIGYLTTQRNEQVQFLGRLLFSESNKWNNLKQKFIETSKKQYSHLYDSQFGVTLTFWTKYNVNTDIDKVAFISFMLGNDEFKLSIKPYSISSNSFEDNDQIDSIDLLADNNNHNVNRNAWTMWSIKIDNSSKNDENLSSTFKNKIGFGVSTYTFKSNPSASLNYSVIKHDKNINLLNDDPVDLISGNYISEPFDSSFINEEEYYNPFENFVINIGYSKEPVANNENVYYYNGHIRNLILFKGHLSPKEEEALFKLGILNHYDWPTVYDSDELTKLIENGNFFLGLVSIYDSNNINIINCNSKYDGNTYIINN